MDLATITELRLQANEGRDMVIQALRAMRELLIEEATKMLDAEANLRRFSDPALGLPALPPPEDMEAVLALFERLGKHARGDMETNGAVTT